MLQPCDCDPYGSLDNNCDPLTGQCACKSDYNGTQCDSCLFGFYGFPDCSLCLCSVEGTKPESCNEDGACSCTEPDGQCDCKVSCLKDIELKFGFMSHLCITKINCNIAFLCGSNSKFYMRSIFVNGQFYFMFSKQVHVCYTYIQTTLL